MCQIRWMDLRKDYDSKIPYHPKKDNIVADAFNRKSTYTLAHMMALEWKLVKEFQKLNLNIRHKRSGGSLANINIQLILVQKIRKAQQFDLILKLIMEDVSEVLRPKFKLSEDYVLRFENITCVSNNNSVKNEILKEVHYSRFIMHPNNTKMY